jgi:hypothetical protein
MNEIQPEEWMILVFDTAIHMNAATRAGVSLNSRRGVHDLKLIFVGGYAKLVTRHDRDQREHRALRLPALGAATGMIVRAIIPNRYLDGVLIALAHKRPARKILRPRFHPLIHGRMD